VTPNDNNPWLQIPALDYDAHMAANGQSAALREIFVRAYTAASPRRLLVLGCATGHDFELVDPRVTETAVGLDVNPEYIEIARRKLRGLDGSLELVTGDVLDAQLSSPTFDLVHAALLFEYVDPAALFARIAGWMAADGLCCVVTQNRAAGGASVSRTGCDSLLVLEGRMWLRSSDEMNGFATRAGFHRISNRDVPLPHGKSFSVSMFRRLPACSSVRPASS
jgi:SAM-dependent methyltransferase